MVIVMTNDELMNALECHAYNGCFTCPFEGKNDIDCTVKLARAALDALNTKDETLDQRQQMALKAIRMALDKGYNVIITPTTCEIRLMP